MGIEAEEPGVLPLVPPEYGGVGLMTAFGLGISLTPLELSALMSALANGGTLYYLQYPRSEEEVEAFVPKVKRQLDFGTEISDIKVGMRAAVEAGTARRADYDPTEPVLGKTGTCTDFRARAHLGWFGSFNEVGRNKLVVVVLLTGGHSVNGPVAAGIAGAIYRQLSEQQYFASASVTPADLIATQACCTR
jgi:cell division protein FtsI/penicillin-binding protein 2